MMIIVLNDIISFTIIGHQGNNVQKQKKKKTKGWLFSNKSKLRRRDTSMRLSGSLFAFP